MSAEIPDDFLSILRAEFPAVRLWEAHSSDDRYCYFGYFTSPSLPPAQDELRFQISVIQKMDWFEVSYIQRHYRSSGSVSFSHQIISGKDRSLKSAIVDFKQKFDTAIAPLHNHNSIEILIREVVRNGYWLKLKTPFTVDAPYIVEICPQDSTNADYIGQANNLTEAIMQAYLAFWRQKPSPRKEQPLTHTGMLHHLLDELHGVSSLPPSLIELRDRYEQALLEGVKFS